MVSDWLIEPMRLVGLFAHHPLVPISQAYRSSHSKALGISTVTLLWDHQPDQVYWLLAAAIGQAVHRSEVVHVVHNPNLLRSQS